MTIGSYQALVNFVGSDNVPVVSRLKDCLMQLNKICSCQKQRKGQKSEECNTLYINTVISHSSELVEYFKTKTNDGEVVFSHNGCHVIKTIKLR